MGKDITTKPTDVEMIQEMLQKKNKKENEKMEDEKEMKKQDPKDLLVDELDTASQPVFVEESCEKCLCEESKIELKVSLIRKIRWQRRRLFRDIKDSILFFKAKRLIKDSRNMIVKTRMQSLADFGLYIDPSVIRLIKKFKIDPDTLTNYSEGGAACLGFSPKTQKWYGWSHRAVYGFKIGDVVETGDCTATSGWTEEFIKENPEEGMRYVLPVGFEAKTLEDAKLMAIAFAASVS